MFSFRRVPVGNGAQPALDEWRRGNGSAVRWIDGRLCYLDYVPSVCLVRKLDLP